MSVGNMKLPVLSRYNTALGPTQSTLVNVPPFTFPGVTSRVFPLRANINILRSFCRSYLNVAPEVCELRPYLPYVLLVVLDYGRMSIEHYNMGWVSQHEIFLGVPLAMWSRDRQGRRVFKKWVVNTPFIVVDNTCSLTTGRETYGWPKVLATLQHSPERWLKDPRNPIRLLTLDVQGIDCTQPDVRLLEIDQQMGQNATLAPPELDMLDPFGRLSRLSRTSWAIGFDLAQILLGAPLSGFGPQDSEGRGRLLFDSLRRLSSFYREPGLDVVTLKQFRDVEDPTQICYQALVESRLSIARYNRGGFLGLYNLLQGDITGGFRIRLHRNPAFPIVESLGLEVVQERTSGGRTVSFLEPFFPFWMSVDLNYGRGRTICWRMRGEPWHKGSKRVQVSHRRSKPSDEAFNTVAGAAAQVWSGPFLLRDATFDVYPLRAHPKVLDRFVQSYLNLNQRLSFRLAGEHVYMVVSANRIFSKERSAAWIEACQIEFHVPIWGGHHQQHELTLATPFAFTNNPVLAMTLREVQGVPAMHATMEIPARLFRHDRPLLTMHLDVFTALGAGMPSETRTLLEVVAKAPAASPSSQAAPPIICELPSFSSGPLTLQRLMLKQFRDAQEPDHACYQSLVLEPWTLSSPTVKPFERESAIRVYRYPSIPLVETLGLETMDVVPPQEFEGAIADVLTPDHPFQVKLDVEIGLGEVLSHAGGSLSWRSFLSSTRPAEASPRTGMKIHQQFAGFDFASHGLQPLINALLTQKRGNAA